MEESGRLNLIDQIKPEDSLALVCVPRPPFVSSMKTVTLKTYTCCKDLLYLLYKLFITLFLVMHVYVIETLTGCVKSSILPSRGQSEKGS